MENTESERGAESVERGLGIRRKKGTGLAAERVKIPNLKQNRRSGDVSGDNYRPNFPQNVRKKRKKMWLSDAQSGGDYQPIMTQMSEFRCSVGWTMETNSSVQLMKTPENFNLFQFLYNA